MVKDSMGPLIFNSKREFMILGPDHVVRLFNIQTYCDKRLVFLEGVTYICMHIGKYVHSGAIFAKSTLGWRQKIITFKKPTEFFQVIYTYY